MGMNDSSRGTSYSPANSVFFAIVETLKSGGEQFCGSEPHDVMSDFDRNRLSDLPEVSISSYTSASLSVIIIIIGCLK